MTHESHIKHKGLLSLTLRNCFKRYLSYCYT